MMGGRVWAESQEGAGSTFRAVIPFKPRLGDHVEPVPRLEGRAALVVEPNSSARGALEARLRGWGLTVTAVASMHDALARIRVRQFDIVLTSIDSLAWGTETPVIFLTAPNGRPAEARDRSAWHAKPFKQSRLLTQIQTLLGSAPLDPAADGQASESALNPAFAAKYPLSILLAEDNPVNRKVATRLLERLGYSVDIAINGVEAIARTGIRSYDAVLMDVQMPATDGLEATREIRRRDGAQGPVIIGLSANAMTQDRDRALEAGMDGYLTKPLSVRELIAALIAASSRVQARVG